MNIYEKLTKIQNELKVPKSKGGTSGIKYKYRSVEDIQEASKAVLMGNKCAVYVQDKVITVADRYFVEATATLVNSEAPEEQISVTALAELDEAPKMMSKAQNTGSTSSYARKYALGGLYNLDDTEDDDATYGQHMKTELTEAIEKATMEDIEALLELGIMKGQDEMAVRKAALAHYRVDDLKKLSKVAIKGLSDRLKKLPNVFDGTPLG